MSKWKVISTAVASLAVLSVVLISPEAQAASFNMPDQSSCDNGSTTLTWEGEGVERPQIAAMTVDGETIADPGNPELNSLGAVICPGTIRGNRTGVSIIWHTADGNTADLTDALTPLGDPVTSDTQIQLVMTDLGERAAEWTFALVYGGVSEWTTQNLATDSASLTVTLTPARTPQGSGDDFNLCTAVPPDCHATKSDADVLGAAMALSFEPGVGSNMRGAYFALTGAMGGWVSSTTASDGSKRLVASLGAPHYLADGTTLNTGNMTAFLPTTVIASLFGLSGSDLDTSILDVVRTSDTVSTSDVPFTIEHVAGGVTLTVPTISFSSPKYTVKLTAAGLKKKQAVARTPSAAKSAVKLIGKNIKANGKAVYYLEVTVRNKLSQRLTFKPTIIAGQKSLVVGQPVYRSKTGKWVTTIAGRAKGQKTLRIVTKNVTLKKLTLTFAKP